MHLEGLFPTTQVGVPSLYPRVGVLILVEEVTINHLYWKLSAASLFNLLCDPVMFSPNVDLEDQSAFACIPLENLAKEAESDVVVQKLKKECPPPVHENLARILS